MKIAFVLSIWMLILPACSTAQCLLETPPVDSKLGTMRSQVGLPISPQQLIPVRQAPVVVLYESGMVGGSFTHGHDPHGFIDLDTAGGQYNFGLGELRRKNKELKDLSKIKRPNKEQADRFAMLVLELTDEALSRVSDWVRKHSDRGWQMLRTTTDTEGCWSLEGLRPGSYAIVVRGNLAARDSAWEDEADVSPGRTILLPLTLPRYVRTGSDGTH